MRGLAIVAGIFAAIAGAIWALTSAYPAGCTLTGQLEGQTCYPALVNIHNIAGPVALVLAVATVVFVGVRPGKRSIPASTLRSRPMHRPGTFVPGSLPKSIVTLTSATVARRTAVKRPRRFLAEAGVEQCVIGDGILTAGDGVVGDRGQSVC
jgi:hypothetical protein